MNILKSPSTMVGQMRLVSSLVGFSLLFLSSFANSASARISAVSTIKENQFYIAKNKPSKSGDRLFKVDLEKKKSTGLKLHKELKNKELIALHKHKNHLFAVAQRNHGGGLKPVIFVYDFKGKSWRKAGTIDCLSFDSIQFSKNQVEVKCERLKGGQAGGYTYESVRTVVAEQVGNEKMILPIEKSDGGDFRYQMEGTPTMWKSFTVFKRKNGKWGNYFSMSSEQL